MSFVPSSPEKPRIRVTEIGEYIRQDSCPRRFKLGTASGLQRRLPFASRLFNALDPILQQEGREREDEWERSLVSQGVRRLASQRASSQSQSVGAPTDQGQSWDEFVIEAGSLQATELAFCRELSVDGELGEFLVSGRVDFATILWRDGMPILRLVECKASRKDRTYHRIQVAIYRKLVRRLMNVTPLVVAGVTVSAESIECVVARVDETNNQSQEILRLEPLELEMEDADIDHLLAEDGVLIKIYNTDVDELPFRLDSKCDACRFNVDCFPESGRLRRLELLNLDTSNCRAMRREGVVTIDDLANLDLSSAIAQEIRAASDFSGDLKALTREASARRSTLPRGEDEPREFSVVQLRPTFVARVPEHEIADERLVRIYLAVDYDYTENRIGALSAHVTASDWKIKTPFQQTGAGYRPWAGVVESDPGNDTAQRPVIGRDVVQIVSSRWTGRYDTDTGIERQLIQAFFGEVVDAIAEVAQAPDARIHFYVWSRSEMRQLVEGCARADSRLLGHLSQLLGCRESLEQLIYSCLQDDIDEGFGLGWTGRGLAVATSLSWFGQRYHWKRRIAGQEVELDRIFEQNIFDFKSTLRYNRANGQWAAETDDTVPRHTFEIRSRFHDSLPAPYWHAHWGTLPTSVAGNEVRAVLDRFARSEQPGYLRAYLVARAHALRWVEERLQPKSSELEKPRLTISELPRFSLNVNDTAAAALDFLRLDQHVGVTTWIADNMASVSGRVARCRSLPLRNVIEGDGNSLTATIDASAFGFELAYFAERTNYAAGDFVRVSPRSNDPERGQTVRQLTAGGITCTIQAIDWQTGTVSLSRVFGRPDAFTLASTMRADPGSRLYDFATIDDSATEFVGKRVDARLRTGFGSYVFRWFDPTNPTVPAQSQLSQAERDLLDRVLNRMEAQSSDALAPDQRQAVVEGLDSRVQLLQGPPGTGKTQTIAVATLARILARRQPGDVVLIACTTHTAVDNLLERLDRLTGSFQTACSAEGASLSPLYYAKVDNAAAASRGNVSVLDAENCWSALRAVRANSVLVLGGTTSGILKAVKGLSTKAAYSSLTDQFQCSTLIVDEASMMVFPHFLSLATCVRQDGEIMLAGDHRQLSPILSHDWEAEDRPPAVVYQPFVSAYVAVDNISRSQPVSRNAVMRSSLRYSFRLPPPIRDLLSRLYRRDDIVLVGGERSRALSDSSDSVWEQIWAGDSGLYLVIHDEERSKKRNPLEAEIIRQILASAPQPQAASSTAVITPYRDQRTLMSQVLADFTSAGGPVDVIDTVERLQGGERPTVFVSGTASDRSAITATSDFILNLNRAVVAFSRTRDRMVVVCSKALTEALPKDFERYGETMLWKSLRNVCSLRLGAETIDGHRVQVFTPELDEEPLPPA